MEGSAQKRGLPKPNAQGRSLHLRPGSRYPLPMTSPAITHELTGSKGRYATRPEPDGPEAELTYSRASDKLIIIDHTGVPDEYRGGNVGLALVQRAVEDARVKGYKILPLCPFAAAQFRRHSDWSDVLNG